MVHVILRAPFGTVHRDVPSNVRVDQIVESTVRQSCGKRADIKGRVVLPEDINVYENGRELRKDLTLAEQGIHYFQIINTIKAASCQRIFIGSIKLSTPVLEVLSSA
jgi:hypothetical protein